MMRERTMKLNRLIAGSASALALILGSAAMAAKIDISAHDIGGQVMGEKGPEAGVWIIAETKDLPTKYAKIVVTDDQGRFVIPELPDANYKVWVRGYGLSDSDAVDIKPGKTVAFKVKPTAPAAADAQHYPGMYWYSLINIPPASEFPGSDKSPTCMPASMDSQATWIDSLKNSCQSCHALGSDNIRHPHVKEPGEFKSSQEMWERRVQSGQAM